LDGDGIAYKSSFDYDNVTMNIRVRKNAREFISAAVNALINA